MCPPQISFISSPAHIHATSFLPSNPNRSTKVHSLLFDTLPTPKPPTFKIVTPTPATRTEIEEAHCHEYIEQLFDGPDQEFKHIELYAKAVAGGSITAAKELVQGKCDIAIHWEGGRHHAKYDKAEGFCYVNDVVLAILTLKQRFQKILYIDIDIHHGDGVEEALYASKSVTTRSFHQYGPGIYPGTGTVCTPSVVNIPLKAGLSHDTFCKLYTDIVQMFKPEVTVLCAGLDGLVGDPLGDWQLELRSFLHVAKSFTKGLILGGGGYNTQNAARCWTAMVLEILRLPIPASIPEHHEYWDEYGPDFEFDICVQNPMRDLNADDVQLHVDRVRGSIKESE